MFSKRTHWPLEPNRLAQLIEKLQSHPVIDLTESNPTRCGLVYEGEKILRSLATQSSLSYRPDPRGPAEARDAILRYYGERGIALDAKQVFITSSTSEAYSYVFRLLADPGDSILVPQPGYPLFDFLARLDGVEISGYPLVFGHGWQMDRYALQQAIRAKTRAVLVVNPNNPTGCYVSSDDRAFLAQIWREHDLAVVADEVFFDYPLETTPGAPPQSLARETETLTFILNGLSKVSGLPQMKLAWIVVTGPAALLDDALSRLEVIADTYLSVSAPLGLALPELLATRLALQPQIQARTRSNLQRLDALLCSPSPVSRLKAEGGWYAVLRVPSIRSDEDWALALLQEDHVLIHPGHFYDFPSEGYLVLSLLPESGKFEDGVRRLLSRIRRMA